MSYLIRYGTMDDNHNKSWEGSIHDIDEKEMGTAQVMEALRLARKSAQEQVAIHGGSLEGCYHRPMVEITKNPA